MASPTAAAPAAPLARGPIRPAEPVVVRHGWEVSGRASAAELTLRDETWLAKVLVKADANGPFTAAALPYGRARRAAGRLEIGASPGEWLHLGPPGPAAAAALVAELEAAVAEAGEPVVVIEQTHGRALLRLTGERAPALLAKVCAIDLSDRVTPDLAAFRSSVAKTVTDVVRDDRDARRSYLLHCDRSYGQYLFDCLLDAGREFGIEVAGVEA